LAAKPEKPETAVKQPLKKKDPQNTQHKPANFLDALKGLKAPENVKKEEKKEHEFKT